VIGRQPIPPEVAAAASRLPASFGLRAYPGVTFSVSLYASYVEPGGAVVLYVERPTARGSWRLFAKATEDELAEEICATPPMPVLARNGSAGALRGYLRVRS
jgi:hypothetical protein